MSEFTVVRRAAALLSLLVFGTPVASAQTPTPTRTAAPLAVPTPEAMPTPEAADEDDDEEEGEGDGKKGVTGPKITGFLIARYDNTDGKGAAFGAENRYSIPAARLNFDGAVHPLLRYHASVDLAEAYVFSAGPRQFAALKDAYIDWNPQKLFKIRAGQFLKPIGYETRRDDNEILPVRRSRVTTVIAGEDVRDTGVAFFFNPTGMFQYALAVTNGSPAGREEFDDHKDLLSRGGFVLNGDAFSFDAGLSATAGQEHNHALGDVFNPGSGGSEATTNYWTTSYDVSATVGPVIVITEAVYGKRTWRDPATGAGVFTVDSTGAYLLVGYKIKDKGVTWMRYEYRELSSGNDDVSNPVASFGGIVPGAPQWSNGVTIGLNWKLVEDRAKLRTEYSARTGYSTSLENITSLTSGPPVGTAAYVDELSHSFAASLEVDF